MLTEWVDTIIKRFTSWLAKRSAVAEMARKYGVSREFVTAYFVCGMRRERGEITKEQWKQDMDDIHRCYAKDAEIMRRKVLSEVLGDGYDA